MCIRDSAGREGELIFSYLYHYTGCTTPFVRPRYDGSHQTVPDLNLKGLASRGIKSVYPSQMDCVGMLKQNGGGICDHEVGTGKTLITGSYTHLFGH